MPWFPRLLLIVLLGGACADPDRRHEQPESDAELAALRALPYLQWDRAEQPSVRGVVRHDAERAWPGVNLYTDDRNQGFALDMDGQIIHRWQLPESYRHCEQFELLAGGDVVFVCVGQALVRVDWDSKVVWRLRLAVHHDVAVLPDGSFLVPYLEQARRFNGWRVKFDAIARVSSSGELLESWSIYDRLDDLQQYHEKRRIDRPRGEQEQQRAFEYYHLNSIELLPETPLGARDERFRAGNLLLCLRNANLIVVLDADSKRVLWHWGPGQLELPHMPTMLANGNLLIFDNGVTRGHSRVIELDPVTGEVVWEYLADPVGEFFSKWRGSNQRLANGNTLICESERGRVFEVTPTGEVVWEFWNPEVRRGQRKRIYRFSRVQALRVLATER